MKKILILSRQTANANFTDLSGKHLILSITSPSDVFTPYIDNQNKNCVGILALKFDDYAENNFENIHPGTILFDERKANLIANFVYSHWSIIDTISINCDAGISRSAGVAQAIYEHFKNEVELTTQQSLFFPNNLVKKMMLKALASQA
jgi:predicted protein tyrosine phosphatase